jgi:hypothetical protein
MNGDPLFLLEIDSSNDFNNNLSIILKFKMKRINHFYPNSVMIIDFCKKLKNNNFKTRHTFKKIIELKKY